MRVTKNILVLGSTALWTLRKSEKKSVWNMIHSDMPLWEINANCRMVLELEGTPIGNEMKAIQQKWFSSFDEFIDHKDEIRYYDVGDGAALAEYLICEENVFGEIPHELQKHIDYHSYGNELEMDDRYLFTTSGVFRYQ